jgi:P-type conjugative transfer protein TrbJ
MQWRKAFLLPLAVCFFPHADAGGLPLGLPAQEITQLLNHAQLAMSYVRQAQQIYNQIQMIRMMTREGLNLSLFPNLAGMVISDVAGIRNLVQATQGLSYGMAANDQMFRDTYQPYAASTAPFSTRYQNWATTTLNTALALAKAAGLQQDSIMNEQVFNSRMQAMMSTPQVADQTLEKANVLAFAMLRQMQNLRLLMSSDMQSKAAYTGYQVAKDQAATDDARQANAYVSRDVDHSQFGSVPGQN